MENRRKDQRYQVRTKGTIRIEGHKVRMQTENLSTGGARITLDRPLLEGAEVTLDLMLKQDDAPLTIQVSGTVVWCAEDMDAGFQAGIAFSIAQSSGTLLSRYLSNFTAA